MKKPTTGNTSFTTMGGIRSNSFVDPLFHMASLCLRWDTWAQADVLQKRTDKTEELFNKMNASVYEREMDWEIRSIMSLLFL